MSINFYDNSQAIIKPFGKLETKIPEIAVACYSKSIIKYAVERYNGKEVGKVSKVPVYLVNYNDKLVLIFCSPVGAPWASMVLEDLISLGIKRAIYFGTCGVLDEISEYEILIPTKSKREEGTSYHYIPNREYIDINEKYIENFINLLQRKGMKYKKCITWTTDAPYRETRNKISKYVNNGITCVDMESSALSAIGKYRNIDVFIFFYAADKIGKTWKKRNLGVKSERKNDYIDLALELSIEICD